MQKTNKDFTLLSIGTALLAGYCFANFQWKRSSFGEISDIVIVFIGLAAACLLGLFFFYKKGRKTMLAAINIGFVVDFALGAFFHEGFVFMFVHFLSGILVASTFIILPTYLAESASVALRGKRLSLVNLFFIAGILLSLIPQEQFRLLFGRFQIKTVYAIGFLLSIIVTVLSFKIKESPRWLIGNDKVSKAAMHLAQIKGVDVDEEMVAIVKSFNVQKKAKRPAEFSYMLAFAMVIFAQLTGFFILIDYSPAVLDINHVFSGSPSNQRIVPYIVCLLIAAGHFVVVDKLPRKKIITLGAITMIISLVPLALFFYTYQLESVIMPVVLFLFLSGFTLSLGSNIWVVLPEIFPNRLRIKGLAASTLVFWLVYLFLNSSFPTLVGGAKHGAGYMLIFFAAMVMVLLFFVAKVFPETKGQSLEEIEDTLTLQ